MGGHSPVVQALIDQFVEAHKPDSTPPGHPEPNGERMLFRSTTTHGADGMIYTHDPYCRQQDDGMTCPDGYMACRFDHCMSGGSNYCADNPAIPCGERYLSLDEILDPCETWYIDKSEDAYWPIRANDTVAAEPVRMQTIQIPEQGDPVFSADACLSLCRNDDDCVGGYYRDTSFEWAECVLLHDSDVALSPLGEPSFPAPIEPQAIDEFMNDFFTPLSVYQVGLFSVCRDHLPDVHPQQ